MWKRLYVIVWKYVRQLHRSNDRPVPSIEYHDIIVMTHEVPIVQSGNEPAGIGNHRIHWPHVVHEGLLPDDSPPPVGNLLFEATTGPLF